MFVFYFVCVYVCGRHHRQPLAGWTFESNVYMYTCVCMFVCVCVRVCVCMYVCMYIFIYVCLYVCLHVCMYVCMYEYLYECMYVSICICVCMQVALITASLAGFDIRNLIVLRLARNSLMQHTCNTLQHTATHCNR